MNINWNEAPTGATHWDNRADLFCKDGYFWHGNKWQPTPSHLGWATDRYTPRPVNTWQPEVGEVCECDWVGAGCFSKAIVRYVGEKIIIVSCDGSERVIFVEEAEQLRPVRTQAQTEREDLIHTASQVLYNNDVLTEWGAAEALFEAGMLKRPKD